MNIQKKLSLFIVFIIIVMLVSITGAATFFMRRILFENVLNDFEYEIHNIKSEINFKFQMLENSGALESERAVKAVQNDLLQKIQIYKFAENDEIFILDERAGILVKDSNDTSNVNYLSKQLFNIYNNRGEKPYVLDFFLEKKYLFYFDKFTEWNWIIVTAIPEDVIYAPIYKLFKFTAITSLFFLFIVLFALMLYKNKLSARYNKIIVALKKIESGYFNVDIDDESDDEIGELTRSVNTTAAALKDYDAKLHLSNAELSALNAKLNNKNNELNKMIIQHNETKNQLVELNKTLEHRINERTIELSAKNEELIDKNDKLNELMELQKINNNELLEFNRQLENTLIELDKKTNEVNEKNSELLLKNSAIDFSAVPIIFTLTDGTITYINSAFLKIWGYTEKDDIIGKPLDIISYDKNLFNAKLGKILGLNNALEEFVAVKSNGDVFYAVISAQVLFDEKKNPICWLTSFLDISELKNNEHKLKLLNNDLERLVSERTVSLEIALAEQRKINDALQKKDNDLAAANIKLEAHAKQLRHSNELLNNQRKELYDTNMQLQETLQELAITTRELSASNRKIKEINQSLEIKVHRRTEELEKSNRELNKTITELDNTHKKLKQAQEKIVESEKYAAMVKLVASISHEIRNPLGAIKNAHYYIKMRLRKYKETAADDKLPQFMNIIENDIERCNKIISELLDFTRMKKPVFNEFDIHKLIDEVIEKSVIPQNIRVEKNFAQNLPALYIDRELMSKAIAHIINNAYFAMQQETNGVLTIITELIDETVKIIFSDTGCGIKNEFINKIFEPLVSSKTRGTGIGLSIVKNIIVEHNGVISAFNNADKGARFVIELTKM